MLKIWYFLIYLLEIIGLRARRLRCVVIPEIVDHPQSFRLYAIGEEEPWLASFLCPCGCGDLIQLSLLRNDSPSWCLTIDEENLPTLSPSVWRTRGCRSHFYLRRGAIDWVRPS